MRRNSLFILICMIVLLAVIGVLLFYIFAQPSTSDMGATGMAVPTTLPASPDQQVALSSEVFGMPMRFMYIVSILVVFVSAILILFGLLLKTLIKDTQ